MFVRDGVASFAGDGTLIPYRSRRSQAALIAARLRDAAAAGCDIACACTQLASVSQRNDQRYGLKPANTRTTLSRR